MTTASSNNLESPHAAPKSDNRLLNHVANNKYNMANHIPIREILNLSSDALFKPNKALYFHSSDNRNVGGKPAKQEKLKS